MTMMTRKTFLRLAGATMATVGMPSWVLSMTPKRTLIRNVDLLTMEKGAEDLKGFDVLIEGDRIASIGRKLSVGDAELVDAAGMILMPGMTDGHRHVWQGIDLGRLTNTQRKINADASPGMKGQALDFYYYDQWKMRIEAAMTAEDFYFAEYIGGLEAIDAGITSYIDFSHGAHSPEHAYASAQGAIASGVGGIFCWAIGQDRTIKLGQTVAHQEYWRYRNAAPTPMHYETAEVIRDKYFASSSGPMHFGIALSNNSTGHPMTSVIEEFRRVRALQPRLITHHVRSTRADPPHPPGYFRTIADLGEAGLLGPDHHLTHANDWSDEELRIMADAGGKICSAPLSSELTSKYHYTCVFARAHALGVDVGLGLDSPLMNTDDYFELVRAGLLSLYRTPQSRNLVVNYTANDMLAFVTREGAKAMGYEDLAGTITVGKRADLVLLRTERFGFPTYGSLGDRVLNFAAHGDIDSVWIAGKRRKKDGTMIGMDWKKLKAERTERQLRINRSAETIKIVD